MSIEPNKATPPPVFPSEEPKVSSKKKRPIEHEEPEEKKAKVDTALKPSDEEWTKKEFHIQWWQESIYYGVIFKGLDTFIKPKLTNAGSWEIIKNTKIGECKTIGHIERVAIEILDREMTAASQQEKKKAVHEQLKKSLKTLANDGIWPAIPLLTGLMHIK